MIDSEIYPFPRDYLKRKNFHNLAQAAPLTLSFPPLLPHERTFVYIKFQETKRTHSHTNKLPELTPAYNCVLVGAFSPVTLSVRSKWKPFALAKLETDKTLLSFKLNPPSYLSDPNKAPQQKNKFTAEKPARMKKKQKKQTYFSNKDLSLLPHAAPFNRKHTKFSNF